MGVTKREADKRTVIGTRRREVAGAAKAERQCVGKYSSARNGGKRSLKRNGRNIQGTWGRLGQHRDEKTSHPCSKGEKQLHRVSDGGTGGKLRNHPKNPRGSRKMREVRSEGGQWDSEGPWHREGGLA